MSGFSGGERLGISRDLAKLEADGGTIPDAVTAADNDYTRLVEQAAQAVTTRITRARLSAKLVDGQQPKPSEWAELAGATEQDIVYKMAIEDALHRYISIAKANADSIIAEIRRAWHDPAVAALQATADATTSADTTDSLLRRGQVDAGTGLALAPKHLKAIQQSVQLQRRLYSFPARSVLANWTNADLPVGETHYPDKFLAALRAGNEPALPTLDQFDQAREQRRLDQQRADAAKPRVPGRRMSLGM